MANGILVIRIEGAEKCIVKKYRSYQDTSSNEFFKRQDVRIMMKAIISCKEAVYLEPVSIEPFHIEQDRLKGDMAVGTDFVH